MTELEPCNLDSHNGYPHHSHPKETPAMSTWTEPRKAASAYDQTCEVCGETIPAGRSLLKSNWTKGPAEAFYHLQGCYEAVVDLGFVVSVNEVPAHLVEAVRDFVTMQLDVLTSELLSGIEDTTTEDLSDEDFDTIARLATNVSEMVR